LSLEGHARPKLLRSGRGVDPSPLGLLALLGPRHLGQAFSPNSDGFGLQLDPRLLGLTFKRGPKLLNLVLQLDPLKL